METKPERCQTCGHKVKPEWRAISMDKQMAQGLAWVYKWAKEKGRHEFKMGEVKHLLTQVQYATFNNWTKFGGLVYRAENQVYGLHLPRIEEFFRGERTVPEKVWKSNKTGEVRPAEKQVKISELKGVLQFLNEKGIYQVEYRPTLL